MGLEITYAGGEEAGAVSERVTIDRHLYLTEDGTKVVAEGDPAGRWLWAAPGQEVPRKEAERLGAIQPEPETEPEPEAEVKPQPKQRTPRTNKARRPAAAKASAEGGE